MKTQTEIQSAPVETKSKSVTTGEAVTGYAILGCLIAGTIGIVKAVLMGGVASAACLLASVAAFGTVCYIYFRRD